MKTEVELDYRKSGNFYYSYFLWILFIKLVIQLPTSQPFEDKYINSFQAIKIQVMGFIKYDIVWTQNIQGFPFNMAGASWYKQ